MNGGSRAFLITIIVILIVFSGLHMNKLYAELSFYQEGYDRYQKGYDHYRQVAKYLFDGANNRGYIEVCKNRSGEVGIFFKDECYE